MRHQLRCSAKLHGVLVQEDGRPLLETTCDSRWCGKRRGVVVVHRFDLGTMQLISTQRFKEPHETRKERHAP